jgi:GTP pyrophosphokinase
VNGRIVKLTYELQNGEKIEILTSPSQEPRKDWLDLAKTSRAQSRIRAYLRKKDSDRAIAEGEELLAKTFKEKGANLKEFLENQAELAKLFDKTNTNTLEELYSGIGFGTISPTKVLHIFFPQFEKSEELILSKDNSVKGSPFYVDGIDAVMTKLARCCTPLPGDSIVGYVSTGRGIVVHKQTCPNIKSLMAHDPDRIVNVAWDPKQGFSAPVKIRAITDDTLGMMNAITLVAKELSINFVEYSAKHIGNDESEHLFSVKVTSKAELDKLLVKLNEIKGLKNVYQV